MPSSKQVFLCSICNVSSGSCSEDCAFCTQSLHNGADVQTYREKPIKTILEEASRAKENRAAGFCLVTAGKSLDEQKVEYISRAAHTIRSQFPHFHLIACCGIADTESIKALKQAGIDSYNHNLETAQSHYPAICSSMDWEARYQTCLNAKEAGVQLCSGGIFGLGESQKQREEFLKSLASLSPMTSPLNFFHPHPTLPVDAEKLSSQEALEIVSMARTTLPETRLMIAGGREVVFGSQQAGLFERGIDAIVVGDYLTTKGRTPEEDIQMVESLGIEIVEACEA